LEGYSRPAKNGRSAQDIRIFDDHAVPGTHKVSISGSVALSSRRWLESYTVTANSLPYSTERAGNRHRYMCKDAFRECC